MIYRYFSFKWQQALTAGWIRPKGLPAAFAWLLEALRACLLRPKGLQAASNNLNVIGFAIHFITEMLLKSLKL